MKRRAQYGRAFKKSLEADVLRFYSDIFKNSDCKAFADMVNGLDVENLLSLKKDFSSVLDTEEKPQLFFEDVNGETANEKSFII